MEEKFADEAVIGDDDDVELEEALVLQRTGVEPREGIVIPFGMIDAWFEKEITPELTAFYEERKA